MILNEKKYAEDLYCGKNQDVKSIIKKIGYVTRYQLYVLGYSDKDNYDYTVKWLHRYHKNFDESCYSNCIADAIKLAHKTPFYNIDHIKITKDELEIISSLDNLRAEKILFVLLCMAKHQGEVYGFSNGLVKYSLPELCKTARVSVPAADREYILYNIIQHGFIGYPKKNNSPCLMVNFIDYNGDEALYLDEIDCKELAYVYLNWKNNGGYNRCEDCGRLFKKNKNRKYCLQCAAEPPVGDKFIVCVDCGKEFSVDSRNTTKCRCNKCQDVKRKEDSRIRSQKYRDKKVASRSVFEKTIQN